MAPPTGDRYAVDKPVKGARVQPRTSRPILAFAWISLLLAAVSGQAQTWLGGAAVGIQVRGARGPLADARVEILYRGPGGESGGPAPRTTSSQGQASFTGLAEGVWDLEVSHPDHLSFIATLSVRGGRKTEVVSSFLEVSGTGRNPLRVKIFQPGTRQLGTPLAVAATPPAAPPEPTKTPQALVGSPKPEAPAAPVDPPEPELQKKSEPAEVTAPPQPATEPGPISEAVSTTVIPVPEEKAVTAPEPMAAAPPEPTPAVNEAVIPAEPPAEATTRPEPLDEAPPAPVAPASPPTSDVEPEEAEPPTVPDLLAEPPAAKPEEVENVAPPPAEPPVAAPPRAAPPQAPVVEGPADDPEPDEPDPAEPAPVEPSPPPAPTPPTGADASARSFRDRTCFECKPGEWAVGASAEVAAGGGCPDGALDRATEAIELLAARVAPALAEYGGNALAPAVLAWLDGDGRAAIEARFEPLLDATSPCRLLAIALPAGARMSGFRYEAFENGQGGDCLGDQPCPVGDGRWLASPGIERGEGATLLWAVFENRSATSSRLARFIGYFAPPSGWRP